MINKKNCPNKWKYQTLRMNWSDVPWLSPISKTCVVCFPNLFYYYLINYDAIDPLSKRVQRKEGDEGVRSEHRQWTYRTCVSIDKDPTGLWNLSEL